MIKISVYYPNSAGVRFDMNYYVSKHLPMVQKKVGPALKSVAAEQGVAGGSPGSPAPYVAVGHLMFDSVDAFQTAFAPHSEAIMADVANYTNVQPIIQISEIKL
ncbi:MAG: EthD family reductase [Candidatus Acidiferrales bacterium]